MHEWTATDWVLIISAVTTAIITIWNNFRIEAGNRKTEAGNAKLDKAAEQLAVVQKSTNGMTEKIIEATAKASEASGFMHGQAKAKAESDAAKVAKAEGVEHERAKAIAEPQKTEIVGAVQVETDEPKKPTKRKS